MDPFARQYQRQQVPEWTAWFLGYEKLVRVLNTQWKAFKTAHPSLGITNATLRLDRTKPLEFRISRVRCNAVRVKREPTVEDPLGECQATGKVIMLSVATEVQHTLMANGASVSMAQFDALPTPHEDGDSNSTTPRRVNTGLTRLVTDDDAAAEDGDHDSPLMDDDSDEEVKDELRRQHNEKTSTMTNVSITSTGEGLTEVTHPRLGIAVHRFQKLNSAFAASLKAELDKVINFATKQEKMLASAAAASVEAVKSFASLSDKEQEQLQVAFRQVYFSLDMLQQYCDLNVMALGQVLKVFDEVTKQDAGAAYSDAVAALPIQLSKTGRIQALKGDMEEAYRRFACDGDKMKAYAVLYQKDQAERVTDDIPVVGSLGYLVGALSILLTLICVEYAAIGQPLVDHNTQTASFWFSVTAVPITFMILFAVNVIIWERYKINYAFLFDLDPVFHWTGKQLLRDQLWYLFWWAAVLYAFLRTVFQNVACDDNKVNARSDIAAWSWPFVVFPLLLVWAIGRAVLDPCRDVNNSLWFLRTLKRIFLTPLYPVMFSDFFICAQLRSLAATWFELQFFWCHLHIGGISDTCSDGYKSKIWILPFIPAFWRFVQCISKYREPPPGNRKKFPHFWHALKFFVDMVAIASIAFHGMGARLDRPNDATIAAAEAVHIICRSANSIYKIVWDLFVDTALLEFRRDPSGKCLPQVTTRKELIFPKFFYVFFFLVNPFLRFAWIGKFSIRTWVTKDLWVWVVFGMCNIFRRFLWNTLRVENEQVNNIENYKATKLAPLPMRKNRVRLATADEMAKVADDSRHLVIGDASGAVVDPEGDGTVVSLDQIEVLPTFFRKLPESEKLQILRIAAPEAVKQFDGIDGEGKGDYLASLPPATIIHAFLFHLGKRTLPQYTLEMGALSPAGLGRPID